jgi:hypothetical protein
MRLSHEVLKAILVPTPPQEDRRGFLVRLFSSLKFGVSLKVAKDGKVTRSFRVGGGADF